jgi:5'-nucleotidase
VVHRWRAALVPCRRPSALVPACWRRRVLCLTVRKRIILTHHKDLNRGDFLIDDRRKNGVDRFRGTHVRFGSKKFPDWPAVMAYLRPRAVPRG